MSTSSSSATAAQAAAAHHSASSSASLGGDRELILNFKLLLARPEGASPASSASAAPALPSGWTARRLIAGFLRRLGGDALSALKSTYPLAQEDDVQFCLTVPGARSCRRCAPSSLRASACPHLSSAFYPPARLKPKRLSLACSCSHLG